MRYFVAWAVVVLCLKAKVIIIVNAMYELSKYLSMINNI